MMPMPQMDIARGASEGLLISSMIVWESGPINAAHIPWKTRKATISVRLVAMPHSIDARMNPATAPRTKFREPILSASQPVIGIATALAMI